jgi:hypothetical protein
VAGHPAADRSRGGERDAVQVTSESIHAGGHVIALADVAYVWHARGATTLAVRGRVLGRGVLVVLLSLPPLVALVCVVSLAWAAQDQGNWKLALVILAAFVVGGLALTPFLELPLGWLDRSYEPATGCTSCGCSTAGGR